MSKILDTPQIYNLIQQLFSIGRIRAARCIEKILSENSRGRVLDVGCGTARYAFLFKSRYVGIDVNHRYFAGKSQPGARFVCGDATLLPFKDAAFDFVYSVVSFHHISIENTRSALKEIVRVCKSGAPVVIVDGLLPESNLDLPGRIICALDRGKHFKRREEFENVLRAYFDITDSRHVEYSYPYNIHAFILCAKESARRV
ncbi:MAG: methyltransferase domain-containing protein [Candidatus Lindowbacteria bacterium]|nr:methyltransferase domain-containing protein [Candidatus Lindowbacteria bacterium]